MLSAMMVPAFVMLSLLCILRKSIYCCRRAKTFFLTTLRADKVHPLAMDPLSLEKSSTAGTGSDSGGGRSFERPRDLSPVQDVETSSQEGDSQKSGRAGRSQVRILFEVT
jgi:hypothetical protein